MLAKPVINPDDYLLRDGSLPMTGPLQVADASPALTDGGVITSGAFPMSFYSQEADAATAVAFSFDTANNLTTAGARLLDFKNNGVDVFHYEYAASSEFMHLLTGSLYIQDFVPDPFVALGVDTTAAPAGFGQSVVSFQLNARVDGTGTLPIATAMSLNAVVEGAGPLAQARAMELRATNDSTASLSGQWGMLNVCGTAAGSTGGIDTLYNIQCQNTFAGSGVVGLVIGFNGLQLVGGQNADFASSESHYIKLVPSTRGVFRSAISISPGNPEGADIAWLHAQVTVGSIKRAHLSYNRHALTLNPSLSPINVIGAVELLGNTSVADVGTATLGPELVTNGDFASAVGWTVPAGWSIAAGVATRSGIGSLPLSQTLSGMVAGRVYRVQYTISGNSDARAGQDNTFVRVGDVELSRYQTPGTYTEFFAAPAGSNVLEFDFGNNQATFTLDDVSVREVLSGDLHVANDIHANGTITGFLTPHAGTATAGTAPLLFQDGVLLTTPEEGAVEYDDGHLFFTNNASRKGVSLSAGVKTSSTVVSNTTTETTVYSHTLPAGELRVGQVLKALVFGLYTTVNGSDTLTVRIKVGGTTIHTYTTTGSVKTAVGLKVDWIGTVRAAGASGTFVDNITIFDDVSIFTDTEAGTHAVDTTASNTLEVTVQWSAATVGNTILVNQGFTEFLH